MAIILDLYVGTKSLREIHITDQRLSSLAAGPFAHSEIKEWTLADANDPTKHVNKDIIFEYTENPQGLNDRPVTKSISLTHESLLRFSGKAAELATNLAKQHGFEEDADRIR